MRPASVGTLTLPSRDPAAAPRIDLNLLADAGDRTRMLEGIALSRRIAASAPLRDLILGEINPGPAANSDAEVQQTMLTTLGTYNHPTSTAPMGADHDPAAVTDHRGMVFGTENLRVADASLLPDIPSTPPHLMIIAAAEYLADQIRHT
ncbi:GMC oxidoreductase [Nocardia brasiliensis]|uniref:GMC oxidoreductase n=1 Tax=Nocardia brasiliensis TaxID=37326 RepID=UPI0037A91765